MISASPRPLSRRIPLERLARASATEDSPKPPRAGTAPGLSAACWGIRLSCHVPGKPRELMLDARRTECSWMLPAG